MKDVRKNRQNQNALMPKYLCIFSACQPGYFGKFCNQTCPPGFFGLKCGGQCVTEYFNCHPVNGCLSDFEIITKSRTSGNEIKELKLRITVQDKNKILRESNENSLTNRNFLWCKI